ncbi:DNA/RNA non-specific endonuclease [Lactobacillus johnsonii]|uniref:DNA/RNA non-specific endonuclease/pyrophosphatase/phosphodiesterase domain-containing protein n=1 Tax=Lactobacillus johnsonii TaxID=33959 RepID=A1YVD2_LACJH|nr:DNA/RNA non-specific endonuclease [Lactobacillus johnsonii]ABM21415.1 hypothetical protein ATCC11506LJ0026 [Lactobacillus johnsonii]MCT3386522.1 hypothetical protein [Lactobacillus johnsonii]
MSNKLNRDIYARIEQTIYQNFQKYFDVNLGQIRLEGKENNQFYVITLEDFDLRKIKEKIERYVSDASCIYPRKVLNPYNAQHWSTYLSKNYRKERNNKLEVANFKQTVFSAKEDLPQNYKDFDKGHLVAKSFKKYMNWEGKQCDRFFYRNNHANIVYQYKESNENLNGCFGQLRFEQAVLKLLNRNIGIYYDVEPIFLNQNDKIPIGTRILTLTSMGIDRINSNNLEVPFHVFIPNFKRG